MPHPVQPRCGRALPHGSPRGRASGSSQAASHRSTALFSPCKAGNQAWLRDQTWITQLSSGTRQLFCPCLFPKLKLIPSPGLRDCRICQTQVKFALVKSFQCQNQIPKRQPQETYSELLLKPDDESKPGKVRMGAGSRKATTAALQLLCPSSPRQSHTRLPDLRNRCVSSLGKNKLEKHVHSKWKQTLMENKRVGISLNTFKA